MDFSSGPPRGPPRGGGGAGFRGRGFYFLKKRKNLTKNKVVAQEDREEVHQGAVVSIRA